jgi:hypothetical protein
MAQINQTGYMLSIADREFSGQGFRTGLAGGEKNTSPKKLNDFDLSTNGGWPGQVQAAMRRISGYNPTSQNESLRRRCKIYTVIRPVLAAYGKALHSPWLASPSSSLQPVSS